MYQKTPKFINKSRGRECECIYSLDVDVAVLSVCGALDAMIDAGSPPDLVLDLSHGGLTSEVSQSESSIVSRDLI